MKLAQDWLSSPLTVELVHRIQADALDYAVTTIQEAYDEGLPVDSAIALVRIKAGNLSHR